MLIVFVIGLQGFDFVSDIILSKKLLTIDDDDEKSTFGKAANATEDDNDTWFLKMTGGLMLGPVILSTLLMIPHWLKNEETKTQRFLTFIFLPVYPQYRALRILGLACCCQANKAIREKEVFDDTVCFVGESNQSESKCFNVSKIIFTFQSHLWNPFLKLI